MIDLAAHHIRIASQIYNIQREYYDDNELSTMSYLIKLVVSFQTMDGRNDKSNNLYGLRNRENNNRDGGLSINKHGSNKKEEEDDRPHQRRRIDETNNGDPEENLDMPVEIDFEGNLDQILNP